MPPEIVFGMLVCVLVCAILDGILRERSRKYAGRRASSRRRGARAIGLIGAGCFSLLLVALSAKGTDSVLTAACGAVFGFTVAKLTELLSVERGRTSDGEIAAPPRTEL